jgi:hypothetical protein
MLEWVRIAVSLAGVILISRIIFILYNRHRVRSALPREKAGLIQEGGYSHVADHVMTNGTDPKEVPLLQTRLQEQGFDIPRDILKGLSRRSI